MITCFAILARVPVRTWACVVAQIVVWTCAAILTLLRIQVAWQGFFFGGLKINFSNLNHKEIIYCFFTNYHFHIPRPCSHSDMCTYIRPYCRWRMWRHFYIVQDWDRMARLLMFFLFFKNQFQICLFSLLRFK